MRTNRVGRRQPDPFPLTWEVPTALAACWLALAAATLLAAQASAGWLTGHSWLWPEPPQLLTAVGGLLSGRIGAGLRVGSGLPPAGLVYPLVGVFELALLAATCWAAARLWTAYGPSRRYGMATRADALTALGVGRLRRVRRIIRPDLY
ncbi:MAG: hypothetical protein WCG47_13255, partial [Dermatophilaceae bacterium]